MVSDLIDLVYKVWKEDAIDRTFFAFEATTIKNMPFCRSIQDDVLLWPFNLDGVYTVKFGCRFLYEEQCRKQPGSSKVEVLKLLWNRIWGLHVPNKIKHLAWKACKNALPTKLNLARRKIITDGCCDVCKTQQENVVYALFLCPDLRPLWSSMPKWNHGTLREQLTEAAMSTSLFSYSTTRAHSHNLNSDGATITEDITTTTALPLPPAQRTPVMWTAPGAHSYKLNFDGATFAEDGTAGIGVVIRNEAGLIMASLFQQIPLPTSVIEVEALAARRAMEFALELGFDNVTLEGDSEVLVKTLKNGGNTLAHYGNLIADILFLTSHFSKVQFSFVRRQCKRLAHSLARRVSIIQQMSIWMEEVPPNLMLVSLVDLHSLS
nr:putative ribonuclease h protein [Quercus suber]